MSDMPDMITHMFECLEQEELDVIFDDISEKLNMDNGFIFSSPEAKIFKEIVFGYNNDFQLFAENWILNEETRKKYMTYCKSKRLKKLFE